MTDETMRQFNVASSDLRVKRRAFSRELSEFLLIAASESPPSREDFLDKKKYFEGLWDVLVAATKSCLSLLSEGDDPDGEIADNLNGILGDLRDRKGRLDYLEEEYLRKLSVAQLSKFDTDHVVEKKISCNVDRLNNRVAKVMTAVVTLPKLVEVVSKNMRETSNSLNEISSWWVALNDDDMRKLHGAVGTLEGKGEEALPEHLVSSNTSNNGTPFAGALAKQTRFNKALSLGQTPNMYLGDGLYGHVRFVIVFRGSFGRTINDSVALFKILLCHMRVLCFPRLLGWDNKKNVCYKSKSRCTLIQGSKQYAKGFSVSLVRSGLLGKKVVVVIRKPGVGSAELLVAFLCMAKNL